MKVCIYGAGAVGGLIGARLAAAQAAEVSAVARGATLQALREHGWRLQRGDETIRVPVRASDDPAALGVQDLVVIGVKAPALPAVARAIAPLLGAHTVVLPAMNGVPWWFAQAVPQLRGEALASVDPDGGLGAAIPVGQVVGCVVHMSAASPQPGLVVHRSGDELIIGEALGGESARVRELAALLARARFEVTVSPDVKRDVWYKLWGNMTMNPIAAMTGATSDQILDDPLVRGFCDAVMREAAIVGAGIGCALAESPDDRNAVTRKLGSFKPSMLQDAEAGRPIELDALVGVVREIAGRLQIATPNLDALLGLARLFARARGLYPAG